MDGSNWLESGDTITTSIGTHSILYKSVSGWHSPTTLTSIYISANQNLYFNFAYTPVHLGQLSVHITGHEDGRWSLNNADWHQSDDTIQVNSSTTYRTVYFKNIADWHTPDPIYIMVNENETSLDSAIYMPIIYTYAPLSITARNPNGRKWRRAMVIRPNKLA